MAEQGIRDSKGKFLPGSTGNAKGRGAGKDTVDHPEPSGAYRADGGWTSALTGIGDRTRDKRLSHSYNGGCSLSYQQIAELWERDDIVAKAIEALPAECFREGYELEISNESAHGSLKEDIEGALEDLGVDKALEKAFQIHRAYGGSAILLGVDDGKPLNVPLKMEDVKSLDWLNVLEPMEVYPSGFYSNASAAKYGEPEFYEFGNWGLQNANVYSPAGSKKASSTKLKPGANQIHESRLIVFEGIRVSRYARPLTTSISPFWGSSSVNRFVDVLRDFDVSFAGAGILATDIGQPVISIDGLREMISKNEEKLRARMAAIELSRSMARAILLDTKEKYERQTTNLQGLPDIMDRLSLRLSAAVGMPLSVLLGYAPATLGAPGTSELTMWHNAIRATQRRVFTPPLRQMTQMVMQSLRKRGAPKKWHHHWRELERMTDAQAAEARLTQARTDSMNIKSGMITSDEARKSRFGGGYSFKTQIEEKKKAPGFLAPLPAGVLPGSTPGGTPGASVPGGPGKPGAPIPQGPNAHGVSGYARRNPTQNGLGANAKQGGDVTPGNRDARRDAVATYAQIAGLTELEYQQKLLEDARATGAGPGIIAFLEDMVRVCDEEANDSDRNEDDLPGKLVMFARFPVVVENPAGSTREWTDTDGSVGQTTMKYPYGYIESTLGTDGDSVDVFLGPDENPDFVFVVHQQSKCSDFEEFDEDKVMLGWSTAEAARDAYLEQYDDPRFFGGLSVLPIDAFRRQVAGYRGKQITEPKALPEGSI